MNYKITIERKDPNPDFEKDLVEWKERGRTYRMDDPRYPSRERIVNALICELTDEQFTAIKAAVFDAFK